MSHFSDSYENSRKKFLESAFGVRATVESYCVCSASDLAIDVAVVGESDAPALVVSSGLHGIEGFFGAAVQLSLFDALAKGQLDDGIRYVFIHALNPYGFKNLRRFDQNNVDLNRNFLQARDQFSGAPSGYSLLDPFLNPQSPPRAMDLYRLQAIWKIYQYGLESLKSSIVCGQYEYPEGIFYGGAAPSDTAKIISEHCEQWIGDARRIAHIDLHSGLGSFGTYKLLLNENNGSARYPWYVNTFGSTSIESLHAVDGTAYRIAGSLGPWLQQKFPQRTYYFVGAEFGTYGPIRVLGAIRAENRAHYHGDKNHRSFRQSKEELMECFCPQSERWRSSVVSASLNIVASAVKGLKTPDELKHDE